MTTKRSSKASQQLELDVVTTGTRAANKVLAEGLDRGRKSGQGYEVSSLPTDAPPIVRVRVEDPAKKHGFRAARFISTSSAYCTTDEIAELLPGRPGFIGRCRLELLLEGDVQDAVHSTVDINGRRVGIVDRSRVRELVTHYEADDVATEKDWLSSRIKASQSIYELEGRPVILSQDLTKDLGLPDSSTAAIDALDRSWSSLSAQIEREHARSTSELKKIQDQLHEKSALLTSLDARKDELDRREGQLKGDLEAFDQLGGTELLGLLEPHRHAAVRTGDHRSNPGHASAQPSADVIVDLSDTANRQGLAIDADVLRRGLIAHIVAAARGSLILYAGPPGSGKSTLAQWLPRTLGMTAGLFAVRPAWIDTTDFLGYFDPRLRHFMPTAFTEFLDRSNRNPSTLCLAVLDEINIARVENFGTELLSKLEASRARLTDSRAAQPTVDLYPQLVAGRTALEVARRLQHEQTDDTTRLLRQLAGHLDIPPRLVLPPNLIVAGTLNDDESTHALSPKVLDRALVVKVPVHPETGHQRHDHQPEVSTPTEDTLHADRIGKILESATDDAERSEQAWHFVRTAFKDVHVPGVHLSFRARQAVRLAPAIAEAFMLDASEALADIVIMKVLSGTRFYRDDRDGVVAVQALERLRDQLGSNGAGDAVAWDLSSAAEVVEKMLDSTDELVRYIE